MPDNITQVEGVAMMAANWERGHPWHRLGTRVSGDMTIEQALELSGSNDHVVPITLRGINPETGESDIDIDDKVGIYSDRFGNMGTMSPDYEIMQRREIAEIAFAIEGLDPEAAHVDTMGNLGPKGEKFFTYIRVPDLVIDPNGIADTIERGLFAATSFNGSMPNVLGESAIRVVCDNTLKMALGRASNLIKVRHTVNAEERIKMAAEALGYIGAVEEAMKAKAEAMLAVKDGEKALTFAMDHIWPIDPKLDLPNSTLTRRMNERGDVRILFEGKDNLNVRLVGNNGWAAYNALVEYLDHARPVRGNGTALLKRSEAAVMPGTVVSQKEKISDLVLASAN